MSAGKDQLGRKMGCKDCGNIMLAPKRPDTAAESLGWPEDDDFDSSEHESKFKVGKIPFETAFGLAVCFFVGCFVIYAVLSMVGALITPTLADYGYSGRPDDDHVFGTDDFQRSNSSNIQSQGFRPNNSIHERMAQKALEQARARAQSHGNVSPAAARPASLSSSYNGPDPVEPVGNAISNSNEISVSQLVLVKWGNSWYASNVVAKRADGTVRITYRGWDNGQENVTVDRILVPLLGKQMPDDTSTTPSATVADQSKLVGSDASSNESESSSSEEVAKLIGEFDTADFGRQIAIINALARHQDKSAAKFVANLLESEMHRAPAMVSLTAFGSIAEKPTSDILVSTNDPAAKAMVLQVLGQIGTRQSIPVLEQFVANDIGLRARVQFAIQRIKRRNPGNN